MMALMKLLANRDLMKFMDKLEKIQNPEFKVSEFELDGKKWIGLLIRDKDITVKKETNEIGDQVHREG